jgi:hypothetical protein
MDYFHFISEDFGCWMVLIKWWVLIKPPKLSEIDRKTFILEKFRMVSTTNVKNNNVKIKFITKLKFKIVINFKRKLGNPALILDQRKNIFYKLYSVSTNYVHIN